MLESILTFLNEYKHQEDSEIQYDYNEAKAHILGLEDAQEVISYY